jgi:hypothetical protein
MTKEFTTTFHGKEYRGEIDIIIAARYSGHRETPKDGSKEHLEEREYVDRLTKVAHALAPIAEKMIQEAMADEQSGDQGKQS